MLDDAIKAVTAAEATLNADQANLDKLNATVQQAQAPVPAAQLTVANDQTAMYGALDNLINEAKAAQASLPSPPPVTVQTGS